MWFSKALDRYTEIERENRILLEKMTNIMQNRGAHSAPYQKKSLNREHRKRELLRITFENQVRLFELTQTGYIETAAR